MFKSTRLVKIGGVYEVIKDVIGEWERRYSVTFGLSYLKGNRDSYFTITGDFPHTSGACHDEILRFHPELKPFIDLHLSDSDGQPNSAVENGWFWFYGGYFMGSTWYSAKPGASRYELNQICADHLRVHVSEIARLREENISHREFEEFVEAQRPRWKAEADSAILLLSEYEQKKEGA